MTIFPSKVRQAVIDASKVVASDRTRRSIKFQMIEIRRRLLVERRPLPDCLIIGAMRGGTSSLFKYLDSHPGTAASLRKEVHFFTHYWDRGSDWYRAHFPITRTRMAFEASPGYLVHPRAASRAAQTVPNARLIVLLREPVARARSHYNHLVRLGLECRPLAKALEEDARLMPNVLHQMENDNHSWRPLLRRCPLYFYLGYYARQLDHWLACFPAENFLILWSEEFYRTPARVLDRVAEFLSLSPGRFSGVGRNFSYSGSRTVDSQRRENQREEPVPSWVLLRFEKENERLAHLLRKRLPEAGLPPWLSDSGPSGSFISDCCRQSSEYEPIY